MALGPGCALRGHGTFRYIAAWQATQLRHSAAHVSIAMQGGETRTANFMDFTVESVRNCGTKLSGTFIHIFIVINKLTTSLMEENGVLKDTLF
jgi:hypothetical protein